jgi:hypothetical protein
LTLHDRNNARVVGFDNAHAIKTKGRKRFSGRKVTWDHKYHMDKVEPYKFESAGRLIDDFWRPLTGRPEDDAMRKNVMKIGILSKDDYRKRTIAIAKGEYKPKKNEPTVWFESMESLGQILSGGAEGQNRTADTGIFSPLLYRLSYLGYKKINGLPHKQ